MRAEKSEKIEGDGANAEEATASWSLGPNVHMPSEERKDFDACMPRKVEQTLLRRLFRLQRLK